MACEVVDKLDELLCDILKPNKIIKHVDTSRLTAAGENYGSIMYKLDITIENKDNNYEEILHIVAKILPESFLIRSIFQVQTTYTSEMSFYEIIIPTLLDFQRELKIKHPLNCFPRCFGTRKNLKENSDIIDDDAVLLFENLFTSGFVNIDRHEGFDLGTAKLILSDLAQFHGVALALKLKKPEVFEKKVKPHCHVFKQRSNFSKDLISLVVEEDEECAKIASEIPDFGYRDKFPSNELYATIIHNDLWTNNTMQKFENGSAIANKFVDFQIFSYGSLAIDVFFYIWSSLPLEILQSSVDYLITFYHEQLVNVLKIHGCDTSPFSLDAFLQEINSIAQFESYHALYFHLIAVQGQKGGYDFEKTTTEDIYKTMSIKAKVKAWYMVKEGSKRGWLK